MRHVPTSNGQLPTSKGNRSRLPGGRRCHQLVLALFTQLPRTTYLGSWKLAVGICLLAVCVASAVLTAQSRLDNATLLKPGTTSWPSFNGDYTGRRFSTLTKITNANVHQLSLAWLFRVDTGAGSTIKSTPLMVNGVLYFTVPDHVWAVDARTGRQLWHYQWKTTGGNHLGNRGVAIYEDWLFVETPDCYLISLNLKDGTERWHKPICDIDRFYYASVAPTIVKDHLIVGVSGDDFDIPGYIQAVHPESGEMQWRFYTVPQKKGDPGVESWPSEEMAVHGGGMTWQPITYDPELNYVFVTTGNPQPVIAHKNRAGDNLFTGSIVAVNADTGKMVWHFQSSPHDTHDWDSTQTAVLIDDEANGQKRKLIAQAARNGHYFLLDRTTGKALVSAEYVKTNWSSGYDSKGQPIPKPEKMPQIAGSLVSPNQGGATNWQSPSFSPQTGLYYVSAARAFSIYYIYDPSENPMGWGGSDRGGWSESMVQAIDYKTGKLRWTHKWEGNAPRSGLISTAGNVLFTGGPSNDLVALNATTGDALWHSILNNSVSNGPITYELDGRQYVVAAAGDTLWTFVMNSPAK
jgi:alcohol dehydrogenase (cytochrome c)